MNPLITSVLDLDTALGGNAGLILGGGLGLYLVQEQLHRTAARTRLPLDRLSTPIFSSTSSGDCLGSCGSAATGRSDRLRTPCLDESRCRHGGVRVRD